MREKDGYPIDSESVFENEKDKRLLPCAIRPEELLVVRAKLVTREKYFAVDLNAYITSLASAANHFVVGFNLYSRNLQYLSEHSCLLSEDGFIINEEDIAKLDNLFDTPDIAGYFLADDPYGTSIIPELDVSLKEPFKPVKVS